MQQQRQSRQRPLQSESPSIFTASEVAEYDYCPLVWWYEQYEPLVMADTEELFARMVELEHEHGPQATTLPEYQVIEQLLLRRDAFEKGREQHREHAQAVAEIANQRTLASFGRLSPQHSHSLLPEIFDDRTLASNGHDPLRRTMRLVIIAIVALAIVCMVASLLFASHSSS